MDLIIAAHYGEVENFLKNESMKFHKRPWPLGYFWEGKHCQVLLIGEGLIKASQLLSAFFMWSHNTYQRVINVGVCGRARSDYRLEIGDMICIRTSFAHLGQPEFRSFTSNTKDIPVCLRSLPVVDCISSAVRVTKKEQAQVLANFAQVVDRELWAVASVAQLFHIDWLSLKVISDDPSNDDDVCEIVLQKAPQYSQNIAQMLAKIYNEKKLAVDEVSNDESNADSNAESNAEVESLINQLVKIEKFFFTHSLKSQFYMFFKSLQSSEEDSTSLIWQECSKLAQLYKGTAKNRTLQLLKWMEKRCNPVMYDYLEKVDGIARKYQSHGIHLKVHYKKDINPLEVSFQCDRPQDMQKKIRQLQKMSDDDISLLTGYSQCLTEYL